MYTSNILAAGVLFASAVFAQNATQAIPPNFKPSATTQLLAKFGSVQLTPGAQLGINVPATQPQLGLQQAPVNYQQSTWFLTMVDPDAPTPQNATSAQILHWLQPNVKLSAGSGAGAFPYVLANQSAPIAPYARPMPPPTSDAHRYIIYLWQQPNATFTVPAAYSGYSATNRTRFNLTDFAARAGLVGPVAATYWLTANNTNGPAPNATGPVVSSTAAATATSSRAASATSSKPAVYTGAASSISAGSLGLTALIAGAGFALGL
ncbi:hypothetical protein B0A49_03282 [Cryomyces minteri]|uniref:PEBP-like protein n=1 Tax=Cryomyces minteri TaxID=331657 RepID=A0A4U0XPE8_9PEZI|nr:hypothetical protein B0A49_03282 [Cryomyces minteri]